jgi:hypothetical protein
LWAANRARVLRRSFVVTALRAWPSDTGGRVRRDVVPLDGVAEHLAQRDERVRDRFRASAGPYGTRLPPLTCCTLLLGRFELLKPQLEPRPACGPVGDERIDLSAGELGHHQSPNAGTRQPPMLSAR